MCLCYVIYAVTGIMLPKCVPVCVKYTTAPYWRPSVFSSSTSLSAFAPCLFYGIARSACHHPGHSVNVFSFSFSHFLSRSHCMNLGLPCRLPRSASFFPASAGGPRCVHTEHPTAGSWFPVIALPSKHRFVNFISLKESSLFFFTIL